VFDLASTLAVRVVCPKMKPFNDIRRGNEERVAHRWALSYVEEVFPQAGAVSRESLLQRCGIIKCRRSFEAIAPSHEFLKRQKR
jgi:hypothetical protein